MASVSAHGIGANIFPNLPRAYVLRCGAFLNPVVPERPPRIDLGAALLVARNEWAARRFAEPPRPSPDLGQGLPGLSPGKIYGVRRAYMPGYWPLGSESDHGPARTRSRVAARLVLAFGGADLPLPKGGATQGWILPWPRACPTDAGLFYASRNRELIHVNALPVN